MTENGKRGVASYWTRFFLTLSGILWAGLVGAVVYIHETDVKRIERIEDTVEKNSQSFAQRIDALKERADKAEADRARNSVTLEFLKEGQTRILLKLDRQAETLIDIQKKMSERG